MVGNDAFWMAVATVARPCSIRLMRSTHEAIASVPISAPLREVPLTAAGANGGADADALLRLEVLGERGQHVLGEGVRLPRRAPR